MLALHFLVLSVVEVQVPLGLVTLDQLEPALVEDPSLLFELLDSRFDDLVNDPVQEADDCLSPLAHLLLLRPVDQKPLEVVKARRAVRIIGRLLVILLLAFLLVL